MRLPILRPLLLSLSLFGLSISPGRPRKLIFTLPGLRPCSALHTCPGPRAGVFLHEPPKVTVAQAE
jgi:hypothetical protein